MFPRAQLNILFLTLTFFTALRLVSSRSVAVSPNNEAKHTEGQVGSKTKQLLCQQNNDVIAGMSDLLWVLSVLAPTRASGISRHRFG